MNQTNCNHEIKPSPAGRWQCEKCKCFFEPTWRRDWVMVEKAPESEANAPADTGEFGMSKFEFVLENDEAIGRLARVTDRTKCQVIRDALSFYQYVVRRRQENKRLYVGPNKHDLTTVEVTSLRNVVPTAKHAHGSEDK